MRNRGKRTGPRRRAEAVPTEAGTSSAPAAVAVDTLPQVPDWAPPGTTIIRSSMTGELTLAVRGHTYQSSRYVALCPGCMHAKDKHSVYRPVCLQDPACTCTRDLGRWSA